jgi:hypothetical protein
MEIAMSANRMPALPPEWNDDFADKVTSYQADDAAKKFDQDAEPTIRLASTLEYDGAGHQLTLTRGDGTVQQFPANNNPDSSSGGRWPNGVFDYERHTAHRDDSPDSAYGSNGNYIFTVPGRDNMGIHSGREDWPDGLGRTGVDHATRGCIRTTDDGTAAIRDAMTSGDPVTRITVQNNH